jgi:hypothetical protein
MRLGLHIPDFTWPQGAPDLRDRLAAVASAADKAGIDRISVMDHVWQIGHMGPPEHEMPEAYTTLGYLAAHTQQASLMTLVTGVTYRSPGLLAKIVTTLDVLSGGRAWLGILEHRLEVLREHCVHENRPYEEIQKTVSYRFDLGEHGERVNEIVDDLGRLGELGVEVAHGGFPRVWEPRTMEIVAEQLVPAVSKL